MDHPAPPEAHDALRAPASPPYDALCSAAAPLCAEGHPVVVGFDVDTARVLDVFDLSSIDHGAPETWPEALSAIVEAVWDAPEPLRSDMLGAMREPRAGFIAAGFVVRAAGRSVAEVAMLEIDP